MNLHLPRLTLAGLAAGLALVLAGLAFAAGPTAASAGSEQATASAARVSAAAAIRKGIRDFARLQDARASQILVRAAAVPNVGDQGRATGTFRITRNGRSAVYRLTRRARTLRLAPAAIEYRVAAVTQGHVPQVPRHVDLAGFLQGRAG